MLTDPLYQAEFLSIFQMKMRQQTHFYKNHFNNQTHKYDSMINDTVEQTLQALCVGMSPWIYLIGLQKLNRFAKRHSPRLRDSAHAYETLGKVLDYYNLPHDRFELTLKDSKDSYSNWIVKTIDDKFLIQLDMNNPWTREKSIQHEVCHYLNDDLKWDPSEHTGLTKAYCYLRYYALAEPRVILKVIKDDFL